MTLLYLTSKTDSQRLVDELELNGIDAFYYRCSSQYRIATTDDVELLPSQDRLQHIVLVCCRYLNIAS